MSSALADGAGGVLGTDFGAALGGTTGCVVGTDFVGIFPGFFSARITPGSRGGKDGPEGCWGVVEDFTVVVGIGMVFAGETTGAFTGNSARSVCRSEEFLFIRSVAELLLGCAGAVGACFVVGAGEFLGGVVVADLVAVFSLTTVFSNAGLPGSTREVEGGVARVVLGASGVSKFVAGAGFNITFS